MTLKEFFKSKLFITNAIAVFAIVVLLVLFGMLFLWLYTDHGESVVIPDLKGRTSTEAEALLDELDLRFEIQDSVYSLETAPGTVLDQFPKPGQKVKEKRTVFITLCAVSQEMISMPQLTDISYRQATNLIESAGLIAGRVEYEPSEFPDLVLKQKVNGRIVREGERIPKGSVVDLVLGTEGDATSSKVPTLFGNNLEDAQLKIQEAYLNLGTVNYDESFSSEEEKIKGQIWKQSPDPTEIFEVAKGTSIDIWLTLDPTKLEAKPETEEPDNSFF